MWRAGAGHVGGAASVMVAEPPISMFTCWRTPSRTTFLTLASTSGSIAIRAGSPRAIDRRKNCRVWAYDLSRQTINIEVELFARISRSVRAQIEARARELGELFQRAPSLSFKSEQTAIDPKLRFPGESSRLPPVRIRCLA
jgi:hypothetical protein